MAGECRVPVLSSWRAAEGERQEITKEVSKDKEHSGPCHVSKGLADIEYAQI